MKHLPNTVTGHFSKRLSANDINIFDTLEIKHTHLSCLRVNKTQNRLFFHFTGKADTPQDLLSVLIPHSSPWPRTQPYLFHLEAPGGHLQGRLPVLTGSKEEDADQEDAVHLCLHISFVTGVLQPCSDTY